MYNGYFTLCTTAQNVRMNLRIGNKAYHSPFSMSFFSSLHQLVVISRSNNLPEEIGDAFDDYALVIDSFTQRKQRAVLPIALSLLMFIYSNSCG